MHPGFLFTEKLHGSNRVEFFIDGFNVYHALDCNPSYHKILINALKLKGVKIILGQFQKYAIKNSKLEVNLGLSRTLGFARLSRTEFA